MLTALIIIGAVLIFLIVTGFALSNTVLKPRHFTWEQGAAHERETSPAAWKEGEFDALPKETFFVDSAHDGTRLCVSWIKSDSGSNKAVIVVHGFGCCTVNSYKYARVFIERGYNVLLYDHRNSGRSGARLTTLGYREKFDLKQMVDIVYDKLGENALVGLHGESMGAATVLMEACADKRIAFVVADCGFSDLTDELAHCLDYRMHLPKTPFVQYASFFTRMRAGFSYADVSPIRDIENSGGLPDTPVMFIHGTKDDFIPCENSQRMYDAIKGKKYIWLCEGAAHARSMATDPVSYAQNLNKFLDENGF